MAHTGKIARLPKRLRARVNRMLEDGATFKAIISFLEKHRRSWPEGVEDFIEGNIHEWKKRGFEDYLQERERLNEVRAQREWALEMIRNNRGSSLQEAGLVLATSQIYDLLREFNPAELKKSLKAGHYLRMLDSLARISRGALAFEKYKEDLSERKSRIQKELDKAKRRGGIRPETLAKIERELNLL